jgi:prolyl 4-hydroxylase
MVGPLHEGCYAGHCLAGDDIHEAMMTYAQAKEWAARNPLCQGFTFQHSSRQPEEEVRVWFKSRLRVLHSDGWWSVALGRGI